MLDNGAGVEIMDRNQALLFEIVLDAAMRIEAAVWNIEIAAHKTRNFNAFTLYFLIMNAVVADVNIGGNEDLTSIGRICKNFLIAGHTGIEADFTGGGADFSGGFTAKYGAIFEKEECVCHGCYLGRKSRTKTRDFSREINFCVHALGFDDIPPLKSSACFFQHTILLLNKIFYHMKKLIFCLLAGLWLLSSCKLPGLQSIEVVPPKARPGDQVLIQNLKGLRSEKGLEVRFGSTGAAVVGSPDSIGLRVLVPNIQSGKTRIQVLFGGKEIGATEMEILAAPALQMVLEMSAEGKIQTLSKQPYSGGYDQGFAHASRQLSYDILNAAGQILFSASIPYPATEQKEVFEDPKEGQIRRSDEKLKTAVFPLKIPNIEGAASIRLYDAAGDLTKSADRSKRKLLQEITLR